MDFISEDNMEEELDKNLTANRTVVYDCKSNTLLEAFQEYIDDFDIDNIIESYDDFDGECLDTIKYLSVEEVEISL